MNVLTGFHAIEEQLRLLKKNQTAPNDVELVYAKAGPRVKKILAHAKELQVPSRESSDKELDTLVSSLHETSRDHRGLVLVFKNGEAEKTQNIVEFDAFMAELTSKQSSGLTVVILDNITDPHNIGAIMRSCDQFGANLLIIPEHGSVHKGDVVARSSAGASSWVPITVVANLVRVVEKLQDLHFWVYAADMKGTSLYDLDLKGNTALVLGSEGSGISRLLKEKCDSVVSIPTCGKIDSLNVSVATGVLLYEAQRQKATNSTT